MPDMPLNLLVKVLVFEDFAHRSQLPLPLDDRAKDKHGHDKGKVYCARHFQKRL